MPGAQCVRCARPNLKQEQMMKSKAIGLALLAVLLTQASVRASGSLSDAALYWSMEEASGVRYDVTGNGLDLTDANGPEDAAGKIGNAVSLVGPNLQQLYADNAPALSPAGSFTWAVWVYFES